MGYLWIVRLMQLTQSTSQPPLARTRMRTITVLSRTSLLYSVQNVIFLDLSALSEIMNFLLLNLGTFFFFFSKKVCSFVSQCISLGIHSVPPHFIDVLSKVKLSWRLIDCCQSCQFLSYVGLLHLLPGLTLAKSTALWCGSWQFALIFVSHFYYYRFHLLWRHCYAVWLLRHNSAVTCT